LQLKLTVSDRMEPIRCQGNQWKRVSHAETPQRKGTEDWNCDLGKPRRGSRKKAKRGEGGGLEGQGFKWLGGKRGGKSWLVVLGESSGDIDIRGGRQGSRSKGKGSAGRT